MPAEGGFPKRLTHHPGDDIAVGWTPDGKQVLFRSARNSFSYFDRLFTAPVQGGFPAELPLPMAQQGSFSPDGSRIAYVPIAQWQQAWKRYRGGQTTPIWIATLSSGRIEKIPRDNSNDFNPMWVGDKIYFLSDWDGPVSLFSYDMHAKEVKKELETRGLDLKSASAGPDAIVYEQFGSLHLYDLKSGTTKQVNVRIAGDLLELRDHFVNVGKRLQNAHISPTGARAVFQAHGEILTVPAEKGDARNLTNSSSVMERDPAWSPDGRWLAYERRLPSHLSGIFLYSIDEGKHTQLTDGMSDARNPMFDKDGKHLYFTASTDSGPSLEPDIHSATRPVTRSVYLVVLAKDQPSPLAPESDEEKPVEEKKSADKKEEEKPDTAKDKPPEKVLVKIDLENIGKRILALSLPMRRYVGLQVGKSGELYSLEAPAPSPGQEFSL